MEFTLYGWALYNKAGIFFSSMKNERASKGKWILFIRHRTKQQSNGTDIVTDTTSNITDHLIESTETNSKPQELLLPKKINLEFAARIQTLKPKTTVSHQEEMQSRCSSSILRIFEHTKTTADHCHNLSSKVTQRKPSIIKQVTTLSMAQLRYW